MNLYDGDRHCIVISLNSLQQPCYHSEKTVSLQSIVMPWPLLVSTGTKATPPGVWLAPFLCLQGDKTMKVVPVKQQPPITVADLIAGAKYHLRVYSHELNSISSKSVTFKTKAGETPPGQVEPGVPARWATLGASLSVVVSTVTQSKLGELLWFVLQHYACSSKGKLK